MLDKELLQVVVGLCTLNSLLSKCKWEDLRTSTTIELSNSVCSNLHLICGELIRAPTSLTSFVSHQEILGPCKLQQIEGWIGKCDQNASQKPFLCFTHQIFFFLCLDNLFLKWWGDAVSSDNMLKAFVDVVFSVQIGCGFASILLFCMLSGGGLKPSACPHWLYAQDAVPYRLLIFSWGLSL